MNPIVREHGSAPARIIALHGGPAAAGDIAPVARTLGERWCVLEPYQRGSGGKPLTVATHIRDLDDVIRERCVEHRPVIVGHSWGAMLALAYAARHPEAAASLVLIGCGTFSLDARAMFEERLAARLSPSDRAEIADTERIDSDDRRLAALGQVMTRAYGHDVVAAGLPAERFDSQAHRETWADMLRLQEEGVYPAAFAAVKMPVLMLHGDVDPHPGPRTRDDLKAHMPQLEYRELAQCGHSPWRERHAAKPFFEMLEAWIEAQ